jgi:hypothetical protein
MDGTSPEVILDHLGAGFFIFKNSRSLVCDGVMAAAKSLPDPAFDCSGRRRLLREK